MKKNRRTFLMAVGGAIGGLAAVAAGGAAWMMWKMRERPHGYDFASGARLLDPTPDCGAKAATEAQTQGPYYTPRTPQRTSLVEPGMTGTRLVVEGRVLTTDCRPVAGAVLDFWSCDAAGVYDNDGFRLRGHQFTDANGRFRLETIKPAAYGDFGITRTPHLHVKLQGEGTRLLTTQLYFPDEPQNASDGIFSDALLIETAAQPDGSINGRFDFVLAHTA